MKIARIILCLAVIVSATVSFVVPAFAATYGGGTVTGYASDTPLDNGTIVELVSGDTTKVKATPESDLQNMFGVTVDPTQLLVSSSNSALENEVSVAVSGTYNVLVSTEAGSIAVGDYITLSSISGVGMNAGTVQQTVFGRAVGAFDGKGVVVGSTSVTDKTTKVSSTVKLGLIPVTIGIERNPNIKSTKADVPDFLQKLGQQIADKQVNPIRIYLSMAITAVSIIAAIAILYSGVRNSVISIGRNPMSKKSIFRALVEIILTSLLILIIGLSAVYLLLKL